MRRRATFVHDAQTEFDPTEIQIKDRRLRHPGLRAAREERLTFGLDELPPEIVQELVSAEELHIRWTSEIATVSVAPFLSSSIPGLHVFRKSKHGQATKICGFLQEAFSHQLRCGHSSTAFISPGAVPSGFASTPTPHFFSVLPSLSQFVAYVQRRFCSSPSDILCYHQMSLLNAVDYVDLDYTSIARTLTLTAYWSKPLPNFYEPTGELIFENQWPLDISSKPGDRVEVGILSSAAASEIHEIQMSGFLTVIGEEDKPKPTLFSFASRHHNLRSRQTYQVSLDQPVGLHPTMRITIASAASLKPPGIGSHASSCGLLAYVVLPSTVFVDRYAFPTSQLDHLFADAHHIQRLRSLHGEVDLEAPDYVVRKWGSAMVFELLAPTASSPSGPWDITIPLHLRYLKPSNGSHTPIEIPWPTLAWACPAEEGTKFPINPFDRTQLGYDGLLDPRVAFYHLQPNVSSVASGGRLVQTIDIPVLNTSIIGGDHVMEWGTIIVILLGFAWVLVKLLPGLIASLRSGGVTQSHTQQSADVSSKKGQ